LRRVQRQSNSSDWRWIATSLAPRDNNRKSTTSNQWSSNFSVNAFIYFCLFLGVRLCAADFTVHEWGTFTSVNGFRWALLSGLEVEEESAARFRR